MNNKIAVSIVCTTYNHAEYCSDAFDSFMSQKTDYRFEVVVHDDASTDGTQEIIKHYASKYPGKFTTILQEQNQYRQGVSPLQLAIEQAHGDYIAICEGDDYWIDNEKLQKQIEYMEKHPECTFCFTNAVTFNQTRGHFEGNMLPRDARERRILTQEQLSVSGVVSIDFPPTASFVFRRRDYQRRPIFSEGTYRGDRYYQLVMTSFGYAHYIDDVCVVYRTNNPASEMGSWNRDITRWIKVSNSLIKLYDEFNEYTDNEYKDAIDIIRNEREYQILWLLGQQKSIRKMKYLCAAAHGGVSEIIKYLFKAFVIKSGKRFNLQ